MAPRPNGLVDVILNIWGQLIYSRPWGITNNINSVKRANHRSFSSSKCPKDSCLYDLMLHLFLQLDLPLATRQILSKGQYTIIFLNIISQKIRKINRIRKFLQFYWFCTHFYWKKPLLGYITQCFFCHLRPDFCPVQRKSLQNINIINSLNTWRVSSIAVFFQKVGEIN